MTAVASVAEIGDGGILLRGAVGGPVLVHFDDQYVWAFTPERDGVRRGDGTWVEWPGALLPYLEGATRLRLADASGARVHFHGEHVFGDAGNPSVRVAFVGPRGEPYSIDKVGHVTRSFLGTSDRVRREVLEATRTVLDELARFGVDAYLSYGALLGAVREGRIIGHDSDTDVCYLSRHTSPADLILESYGLERRLRALGWDVVRMSGGDLKVLWPLSDRRLVHIDVFSAFTIDGVFYQLGNRNGRFDLADLLPLGTVTLEGIEFPAPRRPEAMLEFVYGPSWRVPDPAFRYQDDPRGVRRLDGWLRGLRSEVDAWGGVLGGAGHGGLPTAGSGFAEWVHEQVPADAAILDLGAGNGRDTLWFLRHGHRVRAQDFSGLSMRTVRSLLRAYRIPPGRYEVERLNLNDSRHVLHAVGLLSRDPHHVYGRHLVGCLDETARRHLLMLGRTLRGGQRMFLEFSAAGAGRHLPPAAPAPLVRRLDPDPLAAEIEGSGGVVELLEVRPGVDMFDHHDPAVARLRARWPHPKENQ